MTCPTAPLFHLLDDDLLARFWDRVERQRDDQCWVWKGFRNKSGYGKIYLRNNRRAISSRVALSVKLGRDILPGMFACHHCDNPSCCNPDHLFEGSCLDNVRDCISKGRVKRWHGARRGTNNPRVKLAENDVKRIRSLRGIVTQDKLAAQYRVNAGTIADIMVRRTWSWLP